MKWFPRIIIAAAAVALAARLALPDDRFIVTVFDIGQGDAILAQCGTAQMLVDGGPDANVMAKLGTAMPFFDRTIETVVLTHPHADHYFGLTSVFKQYHVERLFLSGNDGGGTDYLSFMATVEESGAEVVIAQAGDVIEVGDCGRADVLWPVQADPVAHDKSDLNAQSIVMRLYRHDAVSPTAAVLLTGDATDHVEEALLASGALLTADALKVGHHGSRTSSIPEFIDAVGPTYAAVSAAARNKFGHPTPEMLQRMRERGVTTLRTDVEGDIRFLIGTDVAEPLDPPTPQVPQATQ